MKSFVNRGVIGSKKTKMTSSFFLALTIQISIMVIGLSHSANAQVDEAFKTYENEKFGLM